MKALPRHVPDCPLYPGEARRVGAFSMTDIHRHDISDEVWFRLKPYLPGSKGNRGRRGKDNRLFLNAVL
jgi:hypothetical protein